MLVGNNFLASWLAGWDTPMCYLDHALHDSCPVLRLTCSFAPPGAPRP